MDYSAQITIIGNAAKKYLGIRGLNWELMNEMLNGGPTSL